MSSERVSLMNPSVVIIIETITPTLGRGLDSYKVGPHQS